MADRHPPVQDWATDFDHTDPAWTADPYPIWEDLRQRCPVARTGRYGRAWLPVTYDLIREVAYDTGHFTSRSVVASERRPGPDDLPAPSASRRRSPRTRPSASWHGGCCCPPSAADRSGLRERFLRERTFRGRQTPSCSTPR